MNKSLQWVVLRFKIHIFYDKKLQIAKFDQLYKWQRSYLSEPEFVLHDGPPYANGKLHMGHALNKVISN